MRSSSLAGLEAASEAGAGRLLQFYGPSVDEEYEMLITLVKRGADGRRHYYTIHDRQAGLFSNYTLTVVWGASPHRGRERVYGFETRKALERKLRQILSRRYSSGYTLLYSYSRSSNYRTILREEFGSGMSSGAGGRARSGSA
jgi:hypothetical protein